MRSSDSGPIALIAGSGDFPLVFAQAASSLKKEIIVLGFTGITKPDVEVFARETHYVELGAVAKLFDLLKKLDIKKVVLAGGIPKKEVYNPAFAIDNAGRKILNKTPNRGDDHLLKAFEFFLKVKCGATILDARIFLKETLVSKGILTHRAPTDSETRDLKFGLRVAKEIGKMDIGQTVVVKEGIVLAVEALEGTDAAIRRGGLLGNKDVVVVKVSKPNQDLRFDLPCIGPQTLESMKAAGSRVIGVEAGKALILFKEKLIETANRENLSVVGI